MIGHSYFTHFLHYSMYNRISRLLDLLFYFLSINRILWTIFFVFKQYFFLYVMPLLKASMITFLHSQYESLYLVILHNLSRILHFLSEYAELSVAPVLSKLRQKESNRSLG